MDYSSMKATKQSKKKLDSNLSISRKESKQIKRSIKKLKLNWFIVAACLLVGVAAGFLQCVLLFQKMFSQ